MKQNKLGVKNPWSWGGLPNGGLWPCGCTQHCALPIRVGNHPPKHIPDVTSFPLSWIRLRGTVGWKFPSPPSVGWSFPALPSLPWPFFTGFQPARFGCHDGAWIHADSLKGVVCLSSAFVPRHHVVCPKHGQDWFFPLTVRWQRRQCFFITSQWSGQSVSQRGVFIGGRQHAGEVRKMWSMNERYVSGRMNEREREREWDRETVAKELFVSPSTTQEPISSQWKSNAQIDLRERRQGGRCKNDVTKTSTTHNYNIYYELVFLLRTIIRSCMVVIWK